MEIYSRCGAAGGEMTKFVDQNFFHLSRELPVATTYYTGCPGIGGLGMILCEKGKVKVEFEHLIFWTGANHRHEDIPYARK